METSANHARLRPSSPSGAAGGSRIEQLPDAVLGCIAGHLRYTAVHDLALVCKTFWLSPAIGSEAGRPIHITRRLADLSSDLGEVHPQYSCAVVCVDWTGMLKLMSSGLLTSRLQRVEHVEFGHAVVDEAAVVAAVALFPAASSITFDCGGCNVGTLSALECCSRIKFLAIRETGLDGAGQEDDEPGWGDVARLTQLTGLYVSAIWTAAGGFQPERLWHISPITSLTSLQSLQLWNGTDRAAEASLCAWPQGLPAVAQQCAQLTCLELEGFQAAPAAERVSDAGWPALREARLQDLSYAAVAALRLDLAPQLRSLRSYYDHAFEPVDAAAPAKADDMEAAVRSLANVAPSAAASVTRLMLPVPSDVGVAAWTGMLRRLRAAWPNLAGLRVLPQGGAVRRDLLAATAGTLPGLTRLGWKLAGNGSQAAVALLRAVAPPALPALRRLDLKKDETAEQAACALVCAGVAACRPGVKCIVPHAQAPALRELARCLGGAVIALTENEETELDGLPSL